MILRRESICFILICMLLFISSCSSSMKESNYSTKSQEADYKDDISEELDMFENAEKTTNTTGHYFIAECPVFMSDAVDYSRANNTIKATLDIHLEELTYGLGADSKLNLDYNVFFSDNEYISVVYTVSIESKTSAYPLDLKFTINTNLAGTHMKLKDIKTIDDTFIAQFRKHWVDQTDTVLQDYLSEYTDEELLEMFNNCDDFEGSLCSYITNGSIVIIFALPNALGDYTEIVLS